MTIGPPHREGGADFWLNEPMFAGPPGQSLTFA